LRRRKIEAKIGKSAKKSVSVAASEFVKPRSPLLIGLLIGCALLLSCLVYSVTLGAKDLPLQTILESFTTFDRSFNHLVIQTVRLLRALIGAIFLLVSDIAARVLLKPQELPVGIMTAIVGSPFFVYLAKSKVRRYRNIRLLL
jgi:ABC-type Fe3+-siderophore transport system permease subunit